MVASIIAEIIATVAFELAVTSMLSVQLLSYALDQNPTMRWSRAYQDQAVVWSLVAMQPALFPPGTAAYQVPPQWFALQHSGLQGLPTKQITCDGVVKLCSRHCSFVQLPLLMTCHLQSSLGPLSMVLE